MERLQKYLSRAGVASRRHAEELIVEGRVKVNGKVVDELGSRVDPSKDLVLLDGKLVSPSAERKYFLFYKPPGVVTTLSDPEGRPSVGDYVQETGGRVFLFLYTDDFWRDYNAYKAQGVEFVREPAEMPYGTVAVFKDLYGTLWDMVQRKN